MTRAQICSLGLLDYQQAFELQETLVQARKEDKIPDTVLLLRHPNVITLGRKTSDQFLKHSATDLAEMGYPVVHAGRGGEVTFHGPGQLIAYPILKLGPDEQDLHLYLRNLEEVGIRICQSYRLPASRVKGRTGVWVQGKKVAAIGVRARSWVTFHGMAINHSPELEGFNLIVPCGISDAGVTCLEDLVQAKIPADELEANFVQQFAEVFQREMVQIGKEKIWQANTSYRYQ